MEQTDGSFKLNTVSIIYILYIVNFFLVITSLIGLIAAYLYKGEAIEWQKSHYQHQINIFWKTLLGGLLGVATVFILVGVVILLYVFIWYLVHCLKGMKFSQRQEPYPNPTTWGF